MESIQPLKTEYAKELRKIGDTYIFEDGVDIDYSKAMQYYFKAGEQGDSISFLKIGNFYYDGIGIEKDYSKAMYFYLKSGQLENGDAFKNSRIDWRMMESRS